jgi:two-component system, NtrC family, nitrogen regulation response regulator GlnG
MAARTTDDSTLQLPRIRRAPAASAQLALAIVAHPDLTRVGELCAVRDSVEVSRRAPWFEQPGRLDALPLDVPHILRSPVIRIDGDAAGARVTFVHDRARVRCDGEPLHAERVFSGATLQAGVWIDIDGQVGLWLHTRAALAVDAATHGLVGISTEMWALREAIARVGATDAAVLIRGETGTGKELVAAALHAESARASSTMLSVNVGALAPSVLASALFGHRKGAFTGASDARRGYFREANGGTLFLDEIGEANADVQAALLRTLESGEVLPIGADRPERVDVRVIAATDAPLEQAVADGRFRAPLLHRLAQLSVTIPPLRERRVDIAVLFAHFVQREADALGVRWRRDPREPAWVPTSVVERVMAHAWPGNVRELRNAARAAVVQSAGRDELTLPPLVRAVAPTALDRSEAAELPKRVLNEIPLDELLAALEAHAFRPEPAAALLGISKSSMYELIKLHPEIPSSGALPADAIEAALRASGGDIARAAMALRVPKRGLMHRMRKLGLLD